ncbi:MAG: fasciclin domain-containing protein [Bacteroidota bacterium]
MKKIVSARLMIIAAVVVAFTACKKDYITGGEVEDVNKYSNTTTYDVLKENPLYDTLVRMIDTAGLKDKINAQGITLFAPSDYAVFSYLNLRTLNVQATINANKKFALDSLFYYLRNNVKGTRDSLLMYLINKPLMYPILTDMGTQYPTELAGDSAIVSFEYTRNTQLGYNTIVSNVPQIVYFTQLWKPYSLSPANPAGLVPNTIGVRTLVKTSCVITKNGVMNALDNSHTLFFYGTKK